MRPRPFYCTCPLGHSPFCLLHKLLPEMPPGVCCWALVLGIKPNQGSQLQAVAAETVSVFVWVLLHMHVCIRVCVTGVTISPDRTPSGARS